jgi:hypothetical protein
MHSTESGLRSPAARWHPPGRCAPFGPGSASRDNLAGGHCLVQRAGWNWPAPKTRRTADSRSTLRSRARHRHSTRMMSASRSPRNDLLPSRLRGVGAAFVGYGNVGPIHNLVHKLEPIMADWSQREPRTGSGSPGQALWGPAWPRPASHLKSLGRESRGFKSRSLRPAQSHFLPRALSLAQQQRERALLGRPTS